MKHPFFSDSLPIAWSQLTVEHVIPDVEEALRLSQRNIHTIIELSPDDLSYDSTFGALEKATENLSRAWGRIHHLDSVANTPELRKSLGAMLGKVSAFYANLPLNQALWDVLKAAQKRLENDVLNDTQKRFIQETCLDFIEAGANLSKEKKETLAELEAQLAQSTQRFGEYVLDATNAWELYVEDEKELDGLPQSAIDSAAQDAKARGREGTWRFSLQYPSMAPVLQYANSQKLRKTIWQASAAVGSQGQWNTAPLIGEILALRQQKAEILGYPHFADLTLKRRMAKNGKSALDFIENLHSSIVERFNKDIKELENWTAQQCQTSPQHLEPWDWSFWSQKRRKALYDFDEEALRPYFAMPQVMKGLFHIVSTLFHVRIEEVKTTSEGGNIETWHPECRYYHLYDTTTEELLGSFYTDWYPRESKRGGAWMNALETGLPATLNQGRSPHVGLMCGNMTPPIEDKPALLTHRDVETIFHEFGHLLHHLLSDVSVRSLAGTNVAWDFVELPSQIMENFCWKRETLDLFARHYQTGEVIPQELFDKMLAARNYHSSIEFMRQLALAKLDLSLHIDYAKKGSLSHINEVDATILEGYKVPLKTQAPSTAHRLTHLFSSPTGYGSGYYSYKWAEVLDADAFSRFEKEGLLNPQTGASFREHILSKGNSAPPEQLYYQFMGREPNTKALLIRAHLA